MNQQNRNDPNQGERKQQGQHFSDQQIGGGQQSQQGSQKSGQQGGFKDQQNQRVDDPMRERDLDKDDLDDEELGRDGDMTGR